MACRTRNELPGACRAAMRIGKGVVGALDNRQQSEFGRHVALEDFMQNVMIVRLRAFGNPCHVSRVAAVPVKLGFESRVFKVKWQLQILARKLPEVGISLRIAVVALFGGWFDQARWLE